MTLFISHSSRDDGFVRELRETLADHGHAAWIDSRELRGGDLLWTDIEKAIEEASAYAVVVSPEAFQSSWVGKELRHALGLQDERGKDKFPIIPLSLNGTKLGVLAALFGEEPVYIPVASDAGGVEAAMNALLVAIGMRKAFDVPSTPQPQAEPLEDLVLELTDLKFHEKDGVRRASALARLVYEPATPGAPKVLSTKAWRFVAPLGPIEAGDLTWYLEKYAIWPSGVSVIQDRARKVEENLVTWGKLLHDAVMPVAHVANVKEAWANVGEQGGRRFSVYVDPDAAVEAGAPEAQTIAAKEVATLLLGLPWELLHNGKAFLFQGAKPTRVRRRLPNTESRDVPTVATPIRILLITARPEDSSCQYIDHRASALPLVDTMEALPGLVKIHVLEKPTLSGLREELERARAEGKPYHVVHFDGHGVYDRGVGLGGLCFEHPDDVGKLTKRRHATVFTNELGPLLRDHRIPLVFLEACQTAQAEKASESVASALLEAGVASVVAMSHSVLVETASRFVKSFYEALAAGKRVGAAMLEGQRRLKDDTVRGIVFGGEELRLEDWFVPVLFQEKDDPQLFKSTPAKQTVADFDAALKSRLGELPSKPATGFIGRSRELLALERLLHSEKYAVVRGQGGEGKTALAAEFARWMVRSQHVRRAAFVSVETHGNERAVLDAIGRQLVGRNFSAAGDFPKAIQEVERALREQETLLVVDNMESVLLPAFIETPEALSEEADRELRAILGLCERLLDVGDTRLVFTSREALPAPFEAVPNRRELHRLDHEDAVKLVERALDADSSGAATLGDTREAIEALVDAVNGHARTLALLAPALVREGVQKTRLDLVRLMEEMDRQYPPGTLGSREKSVFASVELSLRRMSPENRDRARVLGVFHGGVDLNQLHWMMEWDQVELESLAGELTETGLATSTRYAHLTLNPALCPYLRERLDTAEREELTARWVEVMLQYVEFLTLQRSQNAKMAATLTMLELPNLFALLDLVQHTGDAEATIGLSTSFYILLGVLGKPRLLERVATVRDVAVGTLGETWNHARFQATRTRIEQQLARGSLREALDGAGRMLRRARIAGGQAYPGADHDLGVACVLLARVLQTAGGAQQALPLLDEARQCFEEIAKGYPAGGAELMALVCLAEQGDCLRDLGRLEQAATAYDERIRRGEQLGDNRGVAVGTLQLGTVRMLQNRYPEALEAYAEARERFTELNEPGTVATTWHQIGMVHKQAGDPDAAEDAYRKSLAIEMQLDNVAGQADTLLELGTLYGDVLGRPEEAAAFYREASDKYVEIGNVANEGSARNNLAMILRRLNRLDDARKEVQHAIECGANFGHFSQPWKSWSTLADIEMDAENIAASAEAKRKAIACYLAYRRDGGENHYPAGRICLAVTERLLAGDPAGATSQLAKLAGYPKATSHLPFINVLQAVVAGSRDRTLADASELDYSMAAEILLLIETMQHRQSNN